MSKIPARTRRAATERLLVYDGPEFGPDQYNVLTEPDRDNRVQEHVVDLPTPSCTCEDHQYAVAPGKVKGPCKHVRRVEMVVGIRDVPDVENVDPMIRRKHPDEA